MASAAHCTRGPRERGLTDTLRIWKTTSPTKKSMSPSLSIGQRPRGCTFGQIRPDVALWGIIDIEEPETTAVSRHTTRVPPFSPSVRRNLRHSQVWRVMFSRPYTYATILAHLSDKSHKHSLRVALEGLARVFSSSKSGNPRCPYSES